MICKRNICIYLALIILAFTLILNIKKGGTTFTHPVKRGYLLDRNGEPLVLNIERFQAYYIFRGRSIVGKDIPDEIKAYLPPYFDLPKKGLVLISDSLSYEEMKKFQKIENVIIKGDVKRTPLLEGLRPLLGGVSDNEGVSGLEKAFNSKLKAGESQNLSLDLKLCKRINNSQRGILGSTIQSLAIFKLNTGELLAFLSKEEKNFLLEPFLISPVDLSLQISDVVWEMGLLDVKRKGPYMLVTPLHLAKSYFTIYCERELNPTLLPKKEEDCGVIQSQPEPLFLVIPNKRQWLYFFPRDEKLYIISGYLPQSEKEEEIDWDRFKKTLQNQLMSSL